MEYGLEIRVSKRDHITLTQREMPNEVGIKSCFERTGRIKKINWILRITNRKKKSKMTPRFLAKVTE